MEVQLSTENLEKRWPFFTTWVSQQSACKENQHS